MDWHLVDIDPAHGSGWTGYTWNRELFPDPREVPRRLHDHGLRVTLNVHPADGVRALRGRLPDDGAALGLDPGRPKPIAFDVTDRHSSTAYFEVLHRRLEDDGVDFWWLDWQSGPHSRIAGIDPLWMLNHFHYLDNGRDDRRALTFSRYAGPGSHRYPIGFSGDTVISWEVLDVPAALHRDRRQHRLRLVEPRHRWPHLRLARRRTGHPLGPARHLLTDHAAAFGRTTRSSPRSHGPSRLRPQETMTAFLRLRHRLLPYLHTMNHRAATDGLPLVLPMYYRCPDTDSAYQVPNQYQFGTELLVAAITEPADRRTGLGRVKAWLPEGTWVDVLTDLVYDGGRELYLHRDLTTIPVLAAGGAIVPLDAAAVPGNEPVNPAHLELLVVVGADGRFELIEDDDSATGPLARTPISYDQHTGALVIGPVRGAVEAVPAVRSWTVTFPALDADTDPVATVDDATASSIIRREESRTSITVDGVPVTDALRIDLGPNPQFRENNFPERLFTLLDRAQIEYETKTRVLATVTSERPLAVRLSHLQALDLDPRLITAVGEILLARTENRAHRQRFS